MKFSVVIIVTIISFISCRQYGEVIYNMEFTTNPIDLQNLKSAEDTLHTQFGDYITSLTPIKFTSNVFGMGYQDRVSVPGTNQANSLEYVNQQYLCEACLKPQNHPDRYIDFSSNMVINVKPGLGGSINKNASAFEADVVDFIYFYFMPYYLYQEIELPSQYNGVKIDMFQPNWQDTAIIEGNILKTKHRQILQKMYPSAHIHDKMHFVFGNCDSSFLVNPKGEGISLSVNNPIMNSTESNLIIRSNKYTNMVYHAPVDAETVTMNGLLSFDTRNLIQVYAGADNIPYTSDDIFVYAPRFWERLSSTLEIK